MDVTKLKVDGKEIKDQINALKAKNREVGNDVNKTQKKADGLMVDVTKLKVDGNEIKDQINALKAKDHEIGNEVTKTQNKVVELESQNKKISGHLDKLELKDTEIQAYLDLLQSLGIPHMNILSIVFEV